MRLTAIGTSGSFAGPRSAASAYLVEVPDGTRTRRILLDLGNGAFGALQAICQPHLIDAVVLTHLHPDHCLDLTGFYVYRSYDPAYFCEDLGFDTGKVLSRLPVYGPPGTAERLSAAYHTEPGRSPNAEDSHPTDLATVFDFHDIDPEVPFRIGPVTVTPYLVMHPVEAYALRVETDSAVLTYSGDSDQCDGLVAAARDADLFLCESAFQEGRDTVRGIHLTGKRAGRVATEAGVSRLVLTHIPPWTDSAIVRAEAAREYSGPIELARPGQIFDIDHA